MLGVVAAPGHEDVLVFRLEHQRFGLPAHAVVEVLRAVWVEPLPVAPPVVEGLVDYRGKQLAVFDLRARFGLPLRPVQPEDHMVVVQTTARQAVLRVDRVEALASAPAATTPPGPAAQGLSGVVRLEDALLLIHDPERFLSEAESAALDACLQEQGVAHG